MKTPYENLEDDNDIFETIVDSSVSNVSNNDNTKDIQMKEKKIKSNNMSEMEDFMFQTTNLKIFSLDLSEKNIVFRGVVTCKD